MGEYALYNGERVKIGTCEDMLYLRADQSTSVQPLAGNVDPVRDRDGIRFRFPFPDEDGTEPGRFEKHDRCINLYGVAIPEDVDHYSVQFRADNGYLVNLPCPEDPKAQNPFHVHKNGYGGSVGIYQQRYWQGRLVLVCRCMGCGTVYRLPTLEDAQPVIDAVREMGKKGAGEDFYNEVARRIEAGYSL